MRYRDPERSICPYYNLKNGTPNHPASLLQFPSLSIRRTPSLAASTQWVDGRQYEDNAGGQRVHAHQIAPNHPGWPVQSPTMCELATSFVARSEWNHQELDGTGRQRVQAPQKLGIHALLLPAGSRQTRTLVNQGPPTYWLKLTRLNVVKPAEARVQEKKGCLSTC